MTAVVPARHRSAPARHRAPLHQPGRRSGRHLRPVERPRRSPAVPALVGVGMVIAALLALAVMHALLIGGQVRLDGMRRDVDAQSEAIRRLELRVAELESPDRVLDVARERLGMVQPAEVGYLLPVGVAGGAEDPVRVQPAEVTPPPEPDATETPEETSAGQREVDEAVGGAPADADPGEVAAAAPEQPAEGGRDE